MLRFFFKHNLLKIAKLVIFYWRMKSLKQVLFLSII